MQPLTWNTAKAPTNLPFFQIQNFCSRFFLRNVSSSTIFPYSFLGNLLEDIWILHVPNNNWRNFILKILPYFIMTNMCIVNSIRIMPWKVHNARFCNAYMSSPAIPQRQSDWYLLMGGIHAVWLPARYPRLEQISPAIDWFLLCSMILFMLLVNSTNFHFTKSRLCLSPFEAPYSISKYCVIHCACPYCITIILCVFLLDLRVVLCWKCTWFILRGCQCGVCDMIAE